MAIVLATARSGVTRVWAHRRLLVPFYLANAVFGLMAMLPVGLLLDEYVGNSLMRERLGVAMDFDFFFEFMLGNGDGLAAAQGVALAVMAIYWIVTLFLSGGALTVFSTKTYGTSQGHSGALRQLATELAAGNSVRPSRVESGS